MSDKTREEQYINDIKETLQELQDTLLNFVPESKKYDSETRKFVVTPSYLGFSIASALIYTINNCDKAIISYKKFKNKVMFGENG